jgi:hypothetical protein
VILYHAQSYETVQRKGLESDEEGERVPIRLTPNRPKTSRLVNDDRPFLFDGEGGLDPDGMGI